MTRRPEDRSTGDERWFEPAEIHRESPPVNEPKIMTAEQLFCELPSQILTAEFAPRIAVLLRQSSAQREAFFQQSSRWKRERESMNITIEELAQMVAISPRNLELIEYGYPYPGQSMEGIARRLSDFLEAFRKVRGASAQSPDNVSGD